MVVGLIGVKGTDEMRVDIEKWKPIFPMIYLLLAAIITIACYLIKVPDVVTGAIIGAALSRVKIPAPNDK